MTLASPRSPEVRWSDLRPMKDLNTTPLIDVMLVLLIMFIITLPPMTHAVKVDMPSAITPPPLAPDRLKNKLTIDGDNRLAWNGTPITLAQLGGYLDQTQRMDVAPELQFQPAADADFLIVDRALAVIKRRNIETLGFVGNEQYSRVF